MGREPSSWKGRRSGGAGGGGGPGGGSGGAAGPRNLEGPAAEPLQWELEAVSAQADWPYLRLERRFGRMRCLHLVPRRFIQNISGFWVTAFLNYPHLSAMISLRDEDMRWYLVNLEVREFRHARTRTKFKLRFWNNPFWNKVFVKERGQILRTGGVSCTSHPMVLGPRNPLFWSTGTGTLFAAFQQVLTAQPPRGRRGCPDY